MDIAIIGGGIGGLTLALALHQRGIPCRVYESAPEVKELGVGITLLPHGMRELTALGLGEALAAQGIENLDSCFFNRFGQLIYAEPRGRAAGYPVPEVGIHRGRVHLILWRAAMERLGAARVLTDHQCVGLDQSARDVTLHFRSTATGATRAAVTADMVIACDGVNSAVLASAPGRPASDNGRLCQGAGGHAGGGRCRRGLMLTTLTLRVAPATRTRRPCRSRSRARRAWPPRRGRAAVRHA